ncbi:MAG: glycoside hydrolase family 9 protein [Lewinellaceae bacterium]|nr:glycoside hydrolase family 9 protein [Lewinellaceae bacterium]
MCTEEVMKQARMYFYQRLNFAKQPPYTDTKWADATGYEGPNQDHAARSRWAKTDPNTARDLHGGWMDAGDVNKYTTFCRRCGAPIIGSLPPQSRRVYR